MENIEKIDEVSFKKTIAQPDLVITRTLDDLLLEKESLLTGIQNNKDRITEQTAKLDEIDAEIATVRGLGLKTSVEKQVEEQATLEVAQLQANEEPIIP